MSTTNQQGTANQPSTVNQQDTVDQPSNINQQGTVNQPSTVEQPATANQHGTANQQPSPVRILSLPVELRLQILELLLVCPEPIIISSQKFPNNVANLITPRRQQLFLNVPKRDIDRRPLVDVLRTCRSISEEGLDILYGRNRFIVGRKKNSKPTSPSHINHRHRHQISPKYNLPTYASK